MYVIDNTFMSHGASDEDAEIPALERGLRPAVARNHYGGSSDDAITRTRRFTPPGIPISRAGTDDRPCCARRRSLCTGDVQAPRWRGRATACLFDHQPVDAERDCDARPRDVFNCSAPARQAWLSGAGRSQPPYVWKLLLIVSSSSSCSRLTRSSFRPLFVLSPSP